jgi:hypothetical protein
MWNQANGIRRGPNERDMLSMFSRMRGALSESGAATARSVKSVMRLGAMTIETVHGAELNATYLGHKLEQGYVYLAYRPAYDGGENGHVVVVYGVEPGAVLVVDPGSPLPTVRIPEDWLMRRTSAIVGVPWMGSFTNLNDPFSGLTSR